MYIPSVTEYSCDSSAFMGFLEQLNSMTLTRNYTLQFVTVVSKFIRFRMKKKILILHRIIQNNMEQSKNLDNMICKSKTMLFKKKQKKNVSLK
jgi:hypothetical protein